MSMSRSAQASVSLPPKERPQKNRFRSVPHTLVQSSFVRDKIHRGTPSACWFGFRRGLACEGRLTGFPSRGSYSARQGGKKTFTKRTLAVLKELAFACEEDPHIPAMGFPPHGSQKKTFRCWRAQQFVVQHTIGDHAVISYLTRRKTHWNVNTCSSERAYIWSKTGGISFSWKLQSTTRSLLESVGKASRASSMRAKHVGFSVGNSPPPPPHSHSFRPSHHHHHHHNLTRPRMRHSWL